MVNLLARAELEPAFHFDFIASHFTDWVRGHASGLALLFLGFAVLQTLRLAFLRGAAGRRVARHKRLGEAGERRARGLLKKKGYKLAAEQQGGVYHLRVDGEETAIHLRADFIVKRRGKTYVAEVKSGVESVKVSSRATRRQLLEYLFAFDVDGVLLVDMVAQEIREVHFPRVPSAASSP